MPLLYYARQSQLKTKEGVKQWHLALKKVGRAVNLQQLGEMVAEKCSATPGDVHNVVRNLMSVMRLQLLNSRSVRLDGLGTFTDTWKGCGCREGCESESGDVITFYVYS